MEINALIINAFDESKDFWVDVQETKMRKKLYYTLIAE
jgi:hypothetical protein